MNIQADPLAYVDEPCALYEQMSSSWDLIRDLLGGTLAMQEAAERWLPKEEKESNEAYNGRLKRSILYNAFRDTVDKLASKPFGKPMTLSSDLPEKLSPLWEDCTNSGVHTQTYTRQFFASGVTYGVCHTIVDFPRLDTLQSLEEERTINPRPFFTLVQAIDLIYWEIERDAAGRVSLSKIRIRDKDMKPGSSELYEFVKEWTKTEWTLYIRDEEGSERGTKTWRVYDRGTHSFGEIPLVTFYTSQTGFMTAEPPLEELAWVNLAHWQSMSDQRNILRYARHSFLFGAGFSDDQVEASKDGSFAIGPNSVILTTNADASLEHVEHSGAAIKSGQEDILSLEDKMEVLGMQPQVKRTAQATATGKLIDEARTETELQTWVRNLERAILECFRLASKWADAELGDDFKIQVFSDFQAPMRGTEDTAFLINLWRDGGMTTKRLYEELKRREVISRDIDATTEAGEVLAFMKARNDMKLQADLQLKASSPTISTSNGGMPSSGGTP